MGELCGCFHPHVEDCSKAPSLSVTACLADSSTPLRSGSFHTVRNYYPWRKLDLGLWRLGLEQGIWFSIHSCQHSIHSTGMMYQNGLILLSKHSDEFWSAAHCRLSLARLLQYTVTAEPGSHEYVQSYCQVSIWKYVHRNSLLAHCGWENSFLSDFILGRLSAKPEAVKFLVGQKTDSSFEDIAMALASSSKCYPFPSNITSVLFRFSFIQLNFNSEANLL